MNNELEERKGKGGGGPRLSASLISNLNKKILYHKSTIYCERPTTGHGA